MRWWHPVRWWRGFRRRLRAYRRRLTPRLVWDLFMVYLAIVNLSLIVFDFTYLWLRPTYVRYAPAVTRLYDPVKGIEPHRLTSRYVEVAGELQTLVEEGAAPGEIRPRLEELRRLSRQLLDEDPFERSGLRRNFIRLRVAVRSRVLEESPGLEPDELRTAEAFRHFWSYQPEELPERLAFFHRELEPLLAVNYHRSYDLSGELEDHFWLLDLPFLALFTVEFAARWILAVRRRTYARWFLFPLFNWYDLLGIIPLRQFRLFRLFRIASIYVRLHRSEHTRVGEDIVSRTVKYFANVISEEISDMVALRILSETQEEIRDGTHRRIIQAVVEAHRRALTAELAARVREGLASPEVRRQAREFLDANLDRAAEAAATLRRLPLPKAVVARLVKAIGQAVFDSIVDTLEATVESPEGQEALERMVAGAVDGVAEELTAGEMEELVRTISIQVLEHMKEAVAVKKWTLPEPPASG